MGRRLWSWCTRCPLLRRAARVRRLLWRVCAARYSNYYSPYGNQYYGNRYYNNGYYGNRYYGNNYYGNGYYNGGYYGNGYYAPRGNVGVTIGW